MLAATVAAFSPTLKPENAPFSPTRCTRRHVCKSSGFPRCLIKACCNNQDRMFKLPKYIPNPRQFKAEDSEETRASLIPRLFHCFHGGVALDSHSHLLRIASPISTLAKHDVSAVPTTTPQTCLISWVVFFDSMTYNDLPRRSSNQES